VPFREHQNVYLNDLAKLVEAKRIFVKLQVAVRRFLYVLCDGETRTIAALDNRNTNCIMINVSCVMVKTIVINVEIGVYYKIEL
jgi:hypothetical protein